MSHSLTKAEALAYRERWRLANAREEKELRTTSIEMKWQQFDALLVWARQFDWTSADSNDKAKVWERWARLRKAHRG